ncbi:MAG TPA: type I restriction enzyme HsdR N-terminal domain-containing protein [Crocinitomix sp.]|nr:type I restriction enzyme HsdR N-terminal domain-containing protein [Crocinitomix sp.]
MIDKQKYPPLNLPKADIKLSQNQIWDVLRLKYVKLTPEEWVRQHFIHYLIKLGYSKNLMASEKIVKYNNLSKRCDIVAFNNKNETLLIVECKAPHIKLTQDTFYQVAKYNAVLNAKYLILTNGINHIISLVDKVNNELVFIEEIPHRIDT